MRKLTPFVFIFFLFCVTSGYSQSQTKAASDPYTWDFGQVKQGEILKHSFIFKNDSNKTIYIEDVNTSCGCTASDIEDETLKPKASAPLNVTFKTKGYRGPVTQFIYVHTDNKDNPLVKYTIKAEVLPKENKQ